MEKASLASEVCLYLNLVVMALLKEGGNVCLHRVFKRGSQKLHTQLGVI